VEKTGNWAATDEVLQLIVPFGTALHYFTFLRLMLKTFYIAMHQCKDSSESYIEFEKK